MKKVIINNLITVIGLITITDMTVTVTNVTVTEWLKNFIVVLLAISIGFSNIWPKPTIIIGLTGLFLYIENISNNISYVIYNKIDTTIT